MTDLPTLFRGVSWDDGWEFDGPSVIYYPIMRYGIGGNSGEIERLVEDYCIDLAIGDNPSKGLSSFEKKEFRWRGWLLPMRFKKGYHTTIRVRWYHDKYGDLTFEMSTPETKYRWGW